MKKYSLMLIVGILFQNQIIHTADIYTDTFFNNPSETITLDRNTRDICTDRFADATLYCASLACSLPRWSLNTAFCPGQALIAAKLWDVNPTTCQMKMDDFKKVQCQRCSMFTGAACALGVGAVACSACGCSGAAATAASASKICATGGCIAAQIPLEFSFESSPTGKPKNS